MITRLFFIRMNLQLNKLYTYGDNGKIHSRTSKSLRADRLWIMRVRGVSWKKMAERRAEKRSMLLFGITSLLSLIGRERRRFALQICDIFRNKLVGSAKQMGSRLAKMLFQRQINIYASIFFKPVNTCVCRNGCVDGATLRGQRV